MMTQRTIMTATVRYAFDNDDLEAADRHQHLAGMLDDFTAARLASLGELRGKRCLELGAGGGSVARWLARQGADVLATDFNPRHLDGGGEFRVLHHDLAGDPLPEGEWDVIHARLLMLHLPQRHEILPRLAAALAPGGALVIEDYETTFRKGLLHSPDPAITEAYEAYENALVETVLPARGNDPTWAGRVPGAMIEAGLTDVGTQVHARSWAGGTAGAGLVRANIAQQRAAFVAAGVSEAQLDLVTAAMGDPRVIVRGSFLYSTIGRRAV
jgi:SAM-dependent methyltransferase